MKVENRRYNTQYKQSFGMFSEQVNAIFKSKPAKELMLKGKILVSDYLYLRDHRMQILLSDEYHKMINFDGGGLVAQCPVEDGKVSLLTPTGFLKFKSIYSTLPEAVKKAVKIAERIDKIEAQKEVYFDKNCKKINHFVSVRTNSEQIIKNALESDSMQTKEVIKQVQTAKKDLRMANSKLKKFKTKEYFDKKIKRVFFWN